MDEQFAIEVLSGQRRGFVPAALRTGCRIASWGYGAAMRARNIAYDCGWLKTHHVDAPVISLGNLTAGGTGKTPMAAFLAELLLQRGFHPGIVSRGYRSLNGQANDERLVLEQLLPGIAQVQQPDRVAGAWLAIRQHGCDVILLDDGFQHRRLQRDLNCVLIDATRPWGFGHLLPRGLLREPITALQRADIVFLSRCDQVSDDQRSLIRNELTRSGGSSHVVEVRFVPRCLRNAAGDCRPLSTLASERSLSFCGIGNPEGFRRLLASFDRCSPPVIFPDHHHYTPDDLRQLGKHAVAAHATQLLTTQKDLVKISESHLAGLPVWAVEIAAEIVSGREWLEQALAKSLPSFRHAA